MISIFHFHWLIFFMFPCGTIRREIFPPSTPDFPKNSSEFYILLKQSASVMDCVNPLLPLEISHRQRYELDALYPRCKTLSMGNDFDMKWQFFQAFCLFFSGLSYPEQYSLAQEMVPPRICLGTFCQLVRFRSSVSHDIFHIFHFAWQNTPTSIRACTGLSLYFVSPDESECPSEQNCNITNLDNCDGLFDAFVQNCAFSY